MKRLLSSKIKATLLPIVILTICLTTANVWSQTSADRTVGLMMNDPRAFEGYNLFQPMRYRDIYLINNAGKLVHKWTAPGDDFYPGAAVYLLDNGNLLKTSVDRNNTSFLANGSGGRIVEYDWDGNEVWRFHYESDSYRQHHDIEKLPNGNVLMIAWEVKTAEEAIAAGRKEDTIPSGGNPPGLWVLHIIEVDPTTNDIVWKWHVWDHLIQDHDMTQDNYGNVAEHPELVDINYWAYQNTRRPNDWLHVNGIDYNPELDQILLSIPHFSEIWVIDHSTTIEEAAGHSGGNSGKGGDLLYRWGNPMAYRAGSEVDCKFSYQHNATWIEPGYPGEGNILIFNNGTFDPEWSSIVEITPPCDDEGNYECPTAPGEAFGPEDGTVTGIGEDPTGFFARFMSGAQRLPNGNTLICHAPEGTFVEITPAGEVVWKYINPVIGFYRPPPQGPGPLTQGDVIPPAFQVPPEMGALNNLTFRVTRYAPDFPGFDGKDLTPGDPIELYPISVHVDIKPESCPNPLNAKNQGVLSVAILGTEGFDVTTIDPNSIWLETVMPLRWDYEDVSTPVNDGEECNADGPDGFVDLTLKFDSQEITAALGELSDGDVIQLQLTGNSSGEWFIGKDSVVVRP